jgi:hypothetical protein
MIGMEGGRTGCMARVAIGWMAIQTMIMLASLDTGNQIKQAVCLSMCERNTLRSTRSGTG